MKRRVVVTGMGALTPVGIGKATATVDGQVAATAELTFAVEK